MNIHIYHRYSIFAFFIGISLAWASWARGAGPAESLFRLVPPDAGLTIAVEDLRGQAATFLGSPLAQGLGQLPAVRTWRDSKRFRGFQQARTQIEKALGMDIAEVRDDLLGDAVVLTAHLDPNDRPDQAHGLFLTRVRNRALLDKVILEFNTAQTRKGEIGRVAVKTWKEARYSVRRFRNAAKPDEYYTTLDDDTFAWSNSEDLIRGVIDRGTGGAKGLGDAPKFQAIRRKLPKGAVASLFVDPAFLKRVLADSEGARKPGEERVIKLLERYMGAVEYAGAALVRRDGLVLHTEETVNPDRFDPWLKRWAARPAQPDPDARRVPESALAAASVHVDFPALFEVIEGLVPESQHARLDNLQEVLRGVLLGRDARSAVLPYLGPDVLAYVDAPVAGAEKARPPVVVAVRVGREAAVADALHNGLRTLLALYALDEKHGQGRLKVVAREIDGTDVTALSAASPFAFAVKDGRLALGSTSEAVAGAYAAGNNRRLERFRREHFPDATSFACADLSALHRLMSDRRAALIAKFAAQNHRAEETEARDFDQVLALMNLFEGAYLTSALAPDATSIHRTLGLVPGNRD